MHYAGINDKDKARQVFKDRLEEIIKREERPEIDNSRKLATKSNIAPSYLAKLLNGISIPSLDTIFKLSYALKVDPLEFTSGLEYFIKPADFEIVPNDESSNFEYIKQVNDLYNIFSKEMAIKEDKEIRLIPRQKQITIEDNSMDAVNIIKDSVLLYAFDYNEFINGRIYVVEIDEKVLIRRLWKIDSTNSYILIPCPKKLLDYDIIEVEEKDITILGIPVNITLSI